MRADFVGFAVAEQHVRDAAAEGEFVVQLFVREENVALVHVEENAPLRQRGKVVKVMIPFALGVKHRLIPVLPEFLNARSERGPVVRLKLFRADERHAAAMHPEADGHLLGGVGGRQARVNEMRHERFAGLEHFVRLRGHVHREADVAAEFVADDVEGRFENPGDGGNRSALVVQPLDLRSEGGEISHHCHRAFHEREVVAIRGGLADGRNFGGHARQPDVVEKARGVINQRVILILAHEGLSLGRLDKVKPRRVGDADAGNAVVTQPRRLRQAGPDINHVGNDRVPIEFLGALYRRLERQVVIVRHLLAGQAGVLRGELGHERADGNLVRLLVAQRREVACESLLIKLVCVHRFSFRAAGGLGQSNISGHAPNLTQRR